MTLASAKKELDSLEVKPSGGYLYLGYSSIYNLIVT